MDITVSEKTTQLHGAILVNMSTCDPGTTGFRSIAENEASALCRINNLTLLSIISIKTFEQRNFGIYAAMTLKKPQRVH